MQPPEIYQNYLTSHQINLNSSQNLLLHSLLQLEQNLTYALKHRGNKLFRLLSRNKTLPKSIYIYGKVGRGKSMLMDLFYIESKVLQKRRMHFNEFMTEIYARLFAERAKLGDKKLRNQALINKVANEFCKNCKLLCLDELGLLDTFSAMLIANLFKAFNNKMVIVCTSNLHPAELYQEVIQRDYFTKFADFINAEYIVTEIIGEQDYRLGKIKAIKKIFLSPLTTQNANVLEECFQGLINYLPLATKTLQVKCRELIFRRTSGRTGFFSFEELCVKPLGVEDYIMLCKLFSIVIIENIPKLTADMRNEAKRFMSLVDELYQNNRLLICSSECEPEEIYTQGDGSFEFKRTVSRLIEMQSDQYYLKSYQPDL